MFPLGQGDSHVVKTLPRVPPPRVTTPQQKAPVCNNQALQRQKPQQALSLKNTNVYPRLKKRQHYISARVPATPDYTIHAIIK